MAAQAQPAPTFNTDIAPILGRHCTTCHQPGQIAPFSLIDYQDVRQRARQIAAATASGAMPPWLPEPGYGDFADPRRLAPDEIARIAEWVKQGAPQGDPAQPPARTSRPEGWPLGPPDLVVELPRAYMLSPGAADVFRDFVVPVPLQTTRFVRGIDIDPGNPRVVHHASISLDPTHAARRLDDADPEPGFTGGMTSVALRSPQNRALGWTPGLRPALEAPGLAWPLARGTDLILDMHLIPPREGAPEPVRPRVAFYFAESPPTRMSLDFKLGSKTIDIPAGVSGYTIEDRCTLPVGVDVLSVYPHAHYLAKDMKAFATLPDGSVKWLIWIRNWDFHWQDQYRFTTPVTLPKGTTLTMRYTYDNSAANKHNPSPSPARVRFGPESSDEMGDLWLRLQPGSAADAATLASFYVETERRKDLLLAQRIVERDPRDPKGRNALAASYLESGRLADAEVELREALRLAPGNAETRNNLGHALRAQGRPAEALPHFQEAVRLAPTNDLVHQNLANTLQDLDRIDEAIVEFRLAIGINPDAAGAHNNLGVALGSKGQLQEAEREFRLALEIEPGYADAQQNLDMVLQLRAGQPQVPPR